MKPSHSVESIPQATPDRPWLGLAHFTAADRAYFFGRDNEIQELTDRVRRAPLTVLYGVSGYGKSSLLCAGLIPSLVDDGYRVTLLRRIYDNLSNRSLTDDVIAAVETDWVEPRSSAPPSNDVRPPDGGSPVTLWEYFHDRQRPWFQACATGSETESLGITSDDRPDPSPVIVLDQFEEIFIKGEDRTTTDPEADHKARSAAKQFLTQLADLVENRPPESLRHRLGNATLDEKRAILRRFDFQSRPARVVVALRDDFLARFERWRRLMPALMEHRVELRLLSGPQAFRAVYEPGGKRPNQPPIIPEEVAKAIVQAAADARSEVPLVEIEAVPPILSLLCARLNERRLNANPVPATITEREFSNQEAKRILAGFYEETFRSHPRALCEYLEDELVSDSGFRETVSLDSALAALRKRAGIPDAESRLRQLVDQRILVIEDRGGMARVEFTHDTLAKLARDRRAERTTKRRRRRAVAWLAASFAITAFSLGLTAWALKERARAVEARNEADAAAGISKQHQAATAKAQREAEEYAQQAADDRARAAEQRQNSEQTRSRAEELEVKTAANAKAIEDLKVQEQRAAAAAQIAKDTSNQIADYLTTELANTIHEIPQLDVVAKMLDSLSQFINLPEAEMDSSAWKRKAVFHLSLGRLREAQGSLPLAKKEYEHGLQISRTQSGKSPEDTGWKLLTARLIRNLASVAEDLGSLARANTLATEAHAISLSTASATEDETAAALELVSSWNTLGDLAYDMRDFQKSKTSYAAAMTICTNLGASPNPPEALQSLLSDTIYNAARAASSLGDHGAAQAGMLEFHSAKTQRPKSQMIGLSDRLNSYQIPLSGARLAFLDGRLSDHLRLLKSAAAKAISLAQLDASNATLQASMVDAIINLSNATQVENASEALNAQLALAKQTIDRLAGMDTYNASWQAMRAEVLMALGQVDKDAERWDAATENFKGAQVIYYTLARHDVQNTSHSMGLAEAHIQLSDTYAAQEMPAQALSNLEDALAIIERLLPAGPDDPALKLWACINQTSAAYALGLIEQSEKSKTLAAQSLSLSSSLITRHPRNPWYKLIHSIIVGAFGEFLLVSDDTTAAREKFIEARDICIKVLKDLPKMELAMQWSATLSDTLRSLEASIEAWDSAIEYAKQAVAMRRKVCLGDPESSKEREALAGSLTALGSAYVEKDDQASARPHLVEAVRLFKALDEANKLSDKGYESLNNAETILNKQGRPKWIWPFRLGASRRE